MRVIVHTENNAEDNAMLQALYSRSPDSVYDHLEKLRATGSGKFMDQYYIGYGHASVGDLGFATVYLEGISMLAAKAIEDTELFNGQECSSRYIDFGTAVFHSGLPVYRPFHPGSVESIYHTTAEKVQNMLEAMRSFYVDNLDRVTQYVAEQFPKEDGQTDTAYGKATRARAFDILRGYLPCGASTNVAWTGSLRHLRERLELLMHHPLSEIRTIAAAAYRDLHAKYPHSFVNNYATILQARGDIVETLQTFETREVFEHLGDVSQFYTDILPYDPGVDCMSVVKPDPTQVYGLGTDTDSLIEEISRHPKGYRPVRHGGARTVTLSVHGTLDFGSFRDLQRHRGGYCSMPAVDPYEGFHEWYLENLPHESIRDAVSLLDDIVELDRELMEMNPTTQQRLDNQYFMPMGCLVPFALTYSLSQAIYVAELRSGQTVHSTLRPLAQTIAQCIEERTGNVHFDHRPDTWSTRRGDQDITERKTVEL